MNTQPTPHCTTPTLDLPARLLMADAPRVRDAIVEVIETGVARLVLNLAPVELIDSSGVSVLVTAHKCAQMHGAEVVLAAPSDAIRSLLELTRLHQILPIFDDVAAAANAPVNA